MRFFFQAEDGIRDGHVTGVQTCALPILIEKYKDRLEDTTATAVYELAKDDEQVASMQGHLQLLETISEMTNAEGKKADVKSMTLTSVERFMEALNATDRVKVMRNMNLAVTGGNTVDQAIDAGFPG